MIHQVAASISNFTFYQITLVLDSDLECQESILPVEKKC